MDSPGSIVAASSPRELFSHWVEEARLAARPSPSELAGAYLVDLLAGRLRAPAGRAEPPSLAEAWLGARGAGGPRRLERLRAVGDHALFVAGYFGESLTRKVVGIDYYRDIGRAAYGDLSSGLARRPSARGSWDALYRELAERFSACIEILARVGERTRRRGEDDLLHLHARWIATGSESARRRLLARGCPVDALPRGSVQ